MRDVTTDTDAVESIIRQATICRIAMSDGGQPYVVPVSFGYEDGMKAESVCNWGVRYRSVIGFGQAFFIEDVGEKRRALDIIVTHYGGDPQDYPEAMLEKTAVVRIEIQNASAKVSGYKGPVEE